MNKKFKLFSTIASLCLAVALMAFGVWAATNVSVSVTGTVAFTAAANVKAEVTFSDNIDNFTAGEGFTATSTPKTLYRTKTAEEDAVGSETNTKALGDLTFACTDVTKNMVYTYTLTITNKASESDQYKVLTVAKSGAATTNANTLNEQGITVVVSGTLAETGKIAQGASATVIVTVTVNPNRTVSKTDIGITLALTMTAE